MNLLDDAQELAELVKRFGDSDVTARVASLREGIIRLQEENLRLRESVQSACGSASSHQNVVWEPPYYWVKYETKRDGPFCQVCFDTDKSLIRLQDLKNGAWLCQKCKNGYRDASYTPPKPRRAIMGPGFRNRH